MKTSKIVGYIILGIIAAFVLIRLYGAIAGILMTLFLSSSIPVITNSERKEIEELKKKHEENKKEAELLEKEMEEFLDELRRWSQ